MFSYYKFCDRIVNFVINHHQKRGLNILDQKILSILEMNKLIIIKNILLKKSQLQAKNQQNPHQLSIFQINTLKQISSHETSLRESSKDLQSKIENYIQKDSAKLEIQSKDTQLLHKLLKQIKQRNQSFQYRQNLLKYQSLLRKVIILKIKGQKLLIGAWDEQKVSFKQLQILVLDFLISMLQLNGLIVQQVNDWVKFAKRSKIQEHWNAPIVINLAIVSNIIKKIKILKLK